jgi:hypothetical protein
MAPLPCNADPGGIPPQDRANRTTPPVFGGIPCSRPLGGRPISAVCECCGTALTETDRIDFGLRLPGAVLDRPESDLTRLRKGLLRVADAGCFLRCLLPVRPTGGVELCLGVWAWPSGAGALRCLCWRT